MRGGERGGGEGGGERAFRCCYVAIQVPFKYSGWPCRGHLLREAAQSRDGEQGDSLASRCATGSASSNHDTFNA